MKSGLAKKNPLVSTLRIDYKAHKEAVLTYSQLQNRDLANSEL